MVTLYLSPILPELCHLDRSPEESKDGVEGSLGTKMRGGSSTARHQKSTPVGMTRGFRGRRRMV